MELLQNGTKVYFADKECYQNNGEYTIKGYYTDGKVYRLECEYSTGEKLAYREELTVI